MMNIYVVVISILVTSVSSFASATTLESRILPESRTREGIHVVSIPLDMKSELYKILDGKSAINPDIRYLEILEGGNMGIGPETLNSIFKTLGDFYLENRAYEHAGKAYSEALKLSINDEELRYFISNILGISVMSDANKIAKALADLCTPKR